MAKGSSTRALMVAVWVILCMGALSPVLWAQAAAQTAPAVQHAGGEANLVLPDLGSVDFQGINGRTLLMGGLVVCVLGLMFGLVIYNNLKNLPVHRSMLEISELIYETCKTYLVTQGRFILMLWVFIGIICAVYFGGLAATVDPVTGEVVHGFPPFKVGVILLFSLIGIAGSYGVAWFGIRVNTFANSRAAFAGLEGRPFPIYAIPLKAGMSIGMLLISVELLIMLCILLFIPGDYAGSCFIGFAIGESLGAAVLRIAGGIFTKIADIGADLMKIVFNIKEDDARNPGVIADCTGDNAGDSVGPSADGFETYGVTGVALDCVHPGGREQPDDAGPAPGLDLRHACRRHHRQRRLLPDQRIVGDGALRQSRDDEFRDAAHHAGVADVDRLGDADLCRVLLADRRHRRWITLVEALDRHHVRHAGGCDHSRAGEDLHVHRVGPYPRSGDLVA